ncbi:hypothetical protein DealDRAFT_0985 [Dethiobacter alkaliphilus AHT 1]|uniref:Uncharacterized protein n=1 Tax=Dethiobacter alkaliphilus AHT 1 TaxID=555088 RepID=C0GES6_DETAL|nr:hypothetical protein DealDRAFT_0985 [Dethiobacter alkaliphilus AHT 1]
MHWNNHRKYVNDTAVTCGLPFFIGDVYVALSNSDSDISRHK